MLPKMFFEEKPKNYLMKSEYNQEKKKRELEESRKEERLKHPSSSLAEVQKERMSRAGLSRMSETSRLVDQVISRIKSKD